MAIRPCRVLIAGGGVAGLALAMMLEQTGVDYLLLEAYSEITARAGAGIALLPNGLRILDQLGCYEDIVGHVRHAVDSMDLRDSLGRSLSSVDGWKKRCTDRYGYPLFWIDRAVLLEIMYSHIKNKSKILTQKRVETVQHAQDRIEVVTDDGMIYFGDILVGADGVHSRVKQEMARVATERGMPEYAEDNETSATYGCVFGLSTAVSGIPNACIDFVLNQHFSYIIGSGPEDRTYWLLMVDLGRTFHGKEIPRFNEDELNKVVREHWNDAITPNVSFADLYQHKREVAFTPMQEFVWSKWYLDRSIVIGDAAHKMTAILAQGGNQALESAAALTNALYSVLTSSSTSGRLSVEEIRSMFQQVQDTRSPRVRTVVDASHQRQRMDSMETQEMEDLMLNRFPKMLPGIMQKRWDETFQPAVSLHMLPIPERPKTLPFHDESKRLGNITPEKSLL